MAKVTAASIRAEDRSTAKDFADQELGDQVAIQHRMASVFVRVLRPDNSGRPEVIHTPGEALPAEVAAVLDAGDVVTGADGIAVVDLR